MEQKLLHRLDIFTSPLTSSIPRAAMTVYASTKTLSSVTTRSMMIPTDPSDSGEDSTDASGGCCDGCGFGWAGGNESVVARPPAPCAQVLFFVVSLWLKRKREKEALQWAAARMSDKIANKE